MKRLLLILIIFFFGLNAFAGEKEDALNFFNNYVKEANNYSDRILKMYSDNAKIIRQVIKPDGTLVNAYFTASQYRGQLIISSKIAKLSHYKNNYSNISLKEVSNGYKISSIRMPSMSPKEKLKAYIIIQKQPNNEWLIMEELMQTRQQVFLKYAK